MKTNRGFVPFVVAALLFFVALGVLAQPTAPLLFKPTRREGTIKLKPDPTIVRQRKIALDLSVLQGLRNQKLRLSLFGVGELVLIKNRQETPRENTLIWYGQVADQPGSTVVLANVGEAVSGSVIARDGARGFALYSIRYLGNHVHALRQIDQSKFPPEGPPGKPRIPPSDPGADPCTGDPVSNIDALIVYTDDVRSNAPSISTVESEIYLAVSLTNESYANSDITQRLRLVHMQEVSYNESRNGERDRDRLTAPLDNHADEVHTLRDTYSADVVAMVVHRIDGACGWTWVMDVASTSTAFAPFAYAVVKLTCAADNLSLAHEFGHIMGASHDRYSDPVTDPTGYNHGFVKKTPSIPGTPWYTVMATYKECTERAPFVDCVRLPYWSNPGKPSPPDWGGDPMGVVGSEDNHLRLNDTDSTVANFRCASPDVNNVWMKDTANDTGREPDPQTAAEDMWKSPSIWVRNVQDSSGAHHHDHENPQAGGMNWVYVEMQNDGGAIFGDLEVYVAGASTALSWQPGAWTLVSKTRVDFTPASTRVIEVEWKPAQAGHYCLLARWASAADPMMIAETGQLEPNVRNNNNIVWRNLDVIDLSSMASAKTSFEVGPADDEPFSIVIRTVRRSEGAPSLSDIRLTLEVDDSILGAWRQGGARARNLRNDGHRFVLTQLGEATIENLRLRPGAAGRVNVTIERRGERRQPDFVIDVSQVPGGDFTGRKRPVGGVSYIVRTDRGGGPGR